MQYKSFLSFKKKKETSTFSSNVLSFSFQTPKGLSSFSPYPFLMWAKKFGGKNNYKVRSTSLKTLLILNDVNRFFAVTSASTYSKSRVKRIWAIMKSNTCMESENSMKDKRIKNIVMSVRIKITKNTVN